MFNLEIYEKLFFLCWNLFYFNFFFLHLGSTSDALGHDVKGLRYCEFYNATKCTEMQQGCTEREECLTPEPGKRNHCYVLWQYDNSTKKSSIILKVIVIQSLEHLHINNNYYLINKRVEEFESQKYLIK